MQDDTKLDLQIFSGWTRIMFTSQKTTTTELQKNRVQVTRRLKLAKH